MYRRDPPAAVVSNAETKIAVEVIVKSKFVSNPFSAATPKCVVPAGMPAKIFVKKVVVNVIRIKERTRGVTKSKKNGIIFVREIKKTQRNEEYNMYYTLFFSTTWRSTLHNVEHIFKTIFP